MGKYNALGRECEQLFCEGNNLETIKLITGVSVPTLSKWKNGNNWDIKRKQYQLLPQAIHKKIAKALSYYLDDMLINGVNSSKQSDVVAKLAKAMNTTGGIEDKPGMAVTVQTDFVKYLEKECPDEELKEKLYPYIHDYLRSVKEKHYGSDND